MVNTESWKTDTYYADMESVWSSTYPSITSIEEYEAFYTDTIGRTVSDFVAELMPHVSTERGRLLDFGCDNGIMLNFFRYYGV